MQAPPEFTRQVNHALAHLYDPDVLQKHPLLVALGFNNQPKAQSLLREKLIQSIEELKPSPDVPIESRAWRVYKILHIRYIQQMDQEQTAYQIGVGVRHLRREQNTAVQSLADAIFQKIQSEETGNVTESSEQTIVAAQGDFAWLQQNTQVETTHLADLVQMVCQLVSPLASPRDILLENEIPANLPQVIIFPAAMRQALISMTTYLINRLNSGRIRFSANVEDQKVEFLLSAESQENLLPETSSAQESLNSIRLILGKLSPNLTTQQEGDAYHFRLLLPAQHFINILMIDDNKDVADLFKRYAYGTEFFIEYLANPDLVFEAIAKIQPEIILLDIMIPQVDGWELLGRIRQHPSTQSIPVVVCSVLPERELALALGATSYLSKPATRASLLSTLKQVMDADARQLH